MDCLGSPHANDRKCSFATQLHLDDPVGQSQNPGLQGVSVFHLQVCG